MVSPLSELFGNSMTDTIRIRTVEEYDHNGQPYLYGEERTVRCKLTPIAKREIATYGDLITSTGYKILLPGDDPVTCEDRISFAEYSNLPINGQINYLKDWNGDIIAKEVIVL